MKVFVDSDGVIADFAKLAKFVVKKQFTDDYSYSWAKIDQVPNFFYQLEILPDAIELLNFLKPYNPTILTALPKPTNLLFSAESDKKLWYKKFIDDTLPVICTPEGWVGKLKYASWDSVLIDDSKRNIEGWVSCGGIGIHHIDTKSTIAKFNEIIHRNL
jgi:hypothetical protein